MTIPPLNPKFRKAVLGETFYACERNFTGIATGIIKLIPANPPTPEERNLKPDEIEAEVSKFWQAYAQMVQVYEERLKPKAGKTLSSSEEEMANTIRMLVRSKATDEEIMSHEVKKIPSLFRNTLEKIQTGTAADKALHDECMSQYEKFKNIPSMEDTGEEFRGFAKVFLEKYDPDKYQNPLKNLNPYDIPFFESMNHGDVADLLDKNGNLKVKAAWVDHTTVTSHAVLKAKQEGLLLSWSPDGQRPPNVKNGSRVIIDGDNKAIILGSDTNTWKEYQAKEERYKKGYEALKSTWRVHRKVKSYDGREFKTYINGDTPASAKKVQEYGAQGMGLIRLEGYLADLPENKRRLSVDEWSQYIEEIVNNADRATFVFRLLDVTGDKAMNGFSPEIVEQTDKDFIEAFLKARAAHPNKTLELMVPNVQTAEDLSNKQNIVDFLSELHDLKPYKLGSMDEHPDFNDELEAGNLLPSFVSTGSNDMTAEALEVDRFSQEGGAIIDQRDPLALEQIHRPIIHQRNIGGPDVLPVSICGDLASQPENFALIAGMGYRRLSVAPAMVPVIKELASRIDTGFRFRQIRTDNPELYEKLKKEAQRNDEPDNAWALLQRIMVEKNPAKRNEIMTTFNENHLGLDSHNRVIMNWEPEEKDFSIKTPANDGLA